MAKFSIRGMAPKPWATGELPWRRLVAESCAELTSINHESLSMVAAYEVTLFFFLSPARCHDTDLDNLAEPVLDTIFLIDRPQTPERSLTGALVKRNDNAIRRLTLEKRPVYEPQNSALTSWSSGHLTSIDTEGTGVGQTLVPCRDFGNPNFREAHGGTSKSDGIMRPCRACGRGSQDSSTQRRGHKPTNPE